MTLRSQTIRLAHAKPELRPLLLPLLKQAAEPTPRDVSDEEILEAAKAVASKDPKKRFSPGAVRRELASRDGVPYFPMRGPSMENRFDALVRGRKIITDRSRGFYLLPKATSGSGVEFRPSGGGVSEILLNGDGVGEIRPIDGPMIGATLRREKLFEIDLWEEGMPHVPHDFRTLSEAKSWVKENVGGAKKPRA